MDPNSQTMHAAVMPPDENQWAGAEHEGYEDEGNAGGQDGWDGVEDYGDGPGEHDDLGEEGGDYGEEDGELDEEQLEELGDDIRTYIHDAESAIERLVSSYDIDQLKDQEIWDLVEGFMQRIVGPLHDLEVAHADNKPGFADNFEQIQEEGGEAEDEGEYENGEYEEGGEDEEYDAQDDDSTLPGIKMPWLRNTAPATEAY